jgi:cell division protein FtsI (penicillin-binding protein 3)
LGIICLLVVSFLGLSVVGIKLWLFRDAHPVRKIEQPPQEKATKEDRKKEKTRLPENNFVKRNTIYDRNQNELAISFPLASVYLKPLELRKDEEAIKKLSGILDLNEKELSLSVASERGIVWLARNIDRKMVNKVKNLGISGVYLAQEGVRYYPNGKRASHILGFAQGEQGLAGVESYYNNILTGNISVEAANMAEAGIPSAAYLGKKDISLILTVDLQIEKYLEDRLAELISKHDARSAMAMMMDSRTGEILALTNYPNYDGNFFWKYDSYERRNRLVTDPVRLGAFQHLMRMAAEMEYGNVPDYIEAPEEIAARIIDPKIMKKVISEKLQKAVNPIWKELAKGVYWPVIDRPFNFTLNEKELYEFASSHGFNDPGFIDLPTNGISEADPGKQERVFPADFNSSATGMQILNAFNSLINEGGKVVPHVLKEIWLEKQAEKIAASFEKRSNGKAKESDQKVIRLLDALSAEHQKETVLFETLVEEQDDTKEQGLEFSHDNDVPKMNKEKIGSQQIFRSQDMVLGAVPSTSPEISMILIIDGMPTDLHESSKLQSDVRRILNMGLKMAHSDAGIQKTDRQLHKNELYEQWSRVRAESDTMPISKSSQRKKMPDVRNLSIRKALQVLQNYNVRIRVEGSGRVVGQHPLPGTLLKDINDCVLELKVDN